MVPFHYRSWFLSSDFCTLILRCLSGASLHSCAGDLRGPITKLFCGMASFPSFTWAVAESILASWYSDNITNIFNIHWVEICLETISGLILLASKLSHCQIPCCQNSLNFSLNHSAHLRPDLSLWRSALGKWSWGVAQVNMNTPVQEWLELARICIIA